MSVCVYVIYFNKTVAVWGKNRLITSNMSPQLLHLNIQFRAEHVGLHDSKGSHSSCLIQGKMPCP